MSDQDAGSAGNSDGPGAAETVESTPLTPPRRRIGWWIHLLLIGPYFLPLSLLLQRSYRQPVLTDSWRGLLIVVAIQIAIFSIVFGLGWLASRATPEQMLMPWRPGWRVVPFGIGYSIAIRLIIAIVAILVSVLLLTTIFDENQLREFWQANEPNLKVIVSMQALHNDPVYTWLLLTVVSFVVAGVREELWRAGTLAALRSLWPNAFASRRGEIIAIALIALAFGAGHLPMGMVAAGVTAILGLLLGFIMILHRSLWPAAIAHGCFDATSFALLAGLPANLHHFR